MEKMIKVAQTYEALVWVKHYEKHFVWLYHLCLLINVRAGCFYIFTLREGEKTEAHRPRDLLKPQVADLGFTPGMPSYGAAQVAIGLDAGADTARPHRHALIPRSRKLQLGPPQPECPWLREALLGCNGICSDRPWQRENLSCSQTCP